MQRFQAIGFVNVWNKTIGVVAVTVLVVEKDRGNTANALRFGGQVKLADALAKTVRSYDRRLEVRSQCGCENFRTAGAVRIEHQNVITPFTDAVAACQVAGRVITSSIVLRLPGPFVNDGVVVA